MGDPGHGDHSNISEETKELQKTSLFTVEETKELLKNRETYQYKINGYCRSLEDIKDYIEYERSFLEKIAVRREKFGFYSQRRKIEHKVIARVKYLYELGMNSNPDYNFSLLYFKFCKQYGFHDVARKVIIDMTDKFSTKTEIWEIASSYFLKTNKKEAQSIIIGGLLLHKKCKALYLDALDLELQGELAQDSRDSSISFGGRVKKYIEMIFENIDDFNFLLDILKLLQPHEFSKSVQDAIVSELLKKYSKEELVWQCLAKRENDGYYYTLDEEPSKARMLEEALKESKAKCRLQRCVNTYKKAFRNVPRERWPSLWLLYLDTLIDVQKQNPGVLTNFKADLLHKSLESASTDITLSEKHYAAWIESAGDEETFISILKRATTALPQSCLMWQLRLKYHIKKNDDPTIETVFEEARQALKENSEPIWSMYISYHSLQSNDDKIRSIYLRGVNEPVSISSALKPAYIEWLALAIGIKEARRAYKDIAVREPFCKELHLMMFKLESYELPGFGSDLQEWRGSLQLAFDQFFKEDVDVYLNYIVFYKRYYKSPDSNERIEEKYEEARRYLPENSYLEFKEKCSYV